MAARFENWRGEPKNTDQDSGQSTRVRMVDHETRRGRFARHKRPRQARVQDRIRWADQTAARCIEVGARTEHPEPAHRAPVRAPGTRAPPVAPGGPAQGVVSMHSPTVPLPLGTLHSGPLTGTQATSGQICWHIFW